MCWLVFVSVSILSALTKASKLRNHQVDDVPSTDTFLRRGLHASVVAGNYLYIDRGVFSYSRGSGPVIGNTTHVLALDLSIDWTNSSVVLLPTSKPESAPQGTACSACELSYSEAENCLYTGIVSQKPQTVSPDMNPSLRFWIDPRFANLPEIWANASISPQDSLWAFNLDGKGSGTWNAVKDSSISEEQSRGIAGVASSPQSGWLLGGRDFNDTHTLTDMLQVDLTDRRITSISTPLKLRWPRLQFIPNYGPEGILIAFGSVDGDGGFNWPDFETFPIFDPSEQRWYNQSTTGERPANRAEHCVAGKPSLNQTYEIFLYGGHNFSWGPAAITFDTVYILTLPAFHWVKVDYTPTNPRIAMTCHAVAGSQILIVGGLDPMMGYLKGTLSTQDPFRKGLAVFDLHSLSWADHYSVNSAAYVQSDLVQQYYAQTKPTELDPGVASLFRQANFSKESMTDPGHPPSTPNASSRLSAAPTSPAASKPSHPNRAAIGGSIGGGLACLGASVLTAILLHHRYRKVQPSEKHEDGRRKSMNDTYQAQMLHEADGTPGSLQELSSPSCIHEAGSRRNMALQAWELDSRWLHEAGSGTGSGTRTELA